MKKSWFLATVSLVAVASAALAGEGPHWSYSGHEGPEHWGKISESFHVCEQGRTQSPIDLKESVSADLPDIKINYSPVAPEITNNGHTLQVNVPAGLSMKVGGDIFSLLQFHFHTPSEYQIAGKSYPLEVHLVHKRGDGALGVLGVMFEEGAPNPVLETVLANATAEVGAKETLPEKMDISKLLPTDKKYFRLMGSLTTPPCSEGVHWHMMQAPITASAKQITRFKSFFAMNARPLQPSHHRLIVKDSK